MNDTYGHPAGDTVLKKAAKILRGISRCGLRCATAEKNSPCSLFYH
ncbi:MAG: diguanylate cyclase [Pirellulales bacterium]